MDDLVSVVIPTYNRRRLLPRAIESVLNQRSVQFELIVVDDGSTDGTESALAKSGYPRIRFLRHDVRAGVSEARNTGIKHANGTYLAFLDSDDEWLETYLERQLGALNQEPEAAVSYARNWAHDCMAGVLRTSNQPTPRGEVYLDLLNGWSPHGTSVFVATRQAVLEVGLFDKNLHGFQDWDLWLRLARRFRFAAVEDRLVIHHQHAHERLMTNADLRIPALEAFISKWEDELRDALGPEHVDGFRNFHLRQIHAAAVHRALATDSKKAAWNHYKAYARACQPPQIRPTSQRTRLGLLLALLLGERAHVLARRVRGLVARSGSRSIPSLD